MRESQDGTDVALKVASPWYERLLSYRMAEKWFHWVEWVTLTAALWAVAEKSGSILVYVIALFSACVVFFIGWFSTESVVDILLPSPSELPKVVTRGLTVLFSLIPFAVIYFIAEVIRTLLQ